MINDQNHKFEKCGIELFNYFVSVIDTSNFEFI